MLLKPIRFLLQCSYTICKKSQAENKKAVESYANGWLEMKESFQVRHLINIHDFLIRKTPHDAVNATCFKLETVSVVKCGGRIGCELNV